MTLHAFMALMAVSCVCADAQTFGSCPVFPSTNIWNTPVDKLPVHANSAAYVNSIGLGAYMHPDFGSGLWNGAPIGMPAVAVTGTQTKYPVTFYYHSESDPGPYPIPLNAPIQEGPNSTGDRHVIAVDTTNCKLYEMYKAYPNATYWTATSGAVFDLRSNALRPLNWTSADAAGLPIFAGLVRYEEVAAGEIRHAIRVTAPVTQKAFVWPARHFASWQTDPRYPAMGQRFRLKADFDISGFPAETQVILRAMKKYGLILADNGAPWFISGMPDARWNNTNLLTLRRITGSAFEAVDVSSLMISPDSAEARQQTAAPVISITPATASVMVQGTQRFTAMVSNSADSSVTWLVNGIAGGNSQVGNIDSTGRYVAPSTVPSPNVVKLQARSNADPTVSAYASITITPAVPKILSWNPYSPYTGPLALRVDGVGFLPGAVIQLNGAALPTTYVSFWRLTATGNVSVAGKYSITVVNPDGQVSTPAVLTFVTAP